MNQIFFSYSTKNQEQATIIVDELIANGFIVWHDWRSIEASDNWMEKIDEGLAKSAAFIILWSAEAKASKWVTQELQIALNQGKSDYKIITLCLDNTPLSPMLSLRQAITLPSMLNAKELIPTMHKIKTALPSLQRPRLGFQFDKTLGEQLARQPTTPLVSIPFIDAGLSKAYIVGSPDLRIYKPEIIQVCVQMTRSVSEDMVSDVYQTVQQMKHNDSPVDFIGLHITGPNDGKSYVFDNYNKAEWANALGLITDSVDEFMKSTGKKPSLLQAFVQAPAALAWAVGYAFDKYWNIQIFNWVRPEERRAKHDIYRNVF